jgi:hypothetical protein
MGVLAVPFRSNSTLQRLEETQRGSQQADKEQEPLTALSGHIARFWQAAQTAKFPIERQMLRALRQRQGIYEPDDLAMIKESGGSEIFMMLTSAKCRAAESWLREILLPDTDRPWGLEPTPMPDLPPPVQAAIVGAVTQEALAAGWDVSDARIDDRLLKIKTLAFRRMKELSRKIAERHELKIADQFAEGGWEQALSDAIYDLVTFPAAIIKGPFLRNRLERSWVPGPNGVWVTRVTRQLHLEYERRSPFDIFPAPAMRDIQRGNLIDRYRFTREDIQSLRGVPGYSDTALDQVLTDYGMHGYSSWKVHDLERARLELRPSEFYDPEGMIEALNFWGSVPGRLLMEWQYNYKLDLGIKLDPYREYQIEAWKIGRYVIKAIPNPDPLGQKIYDKASFEEIPGAFWGLSVPDVGLDCQRMCNAAARSIANNAAVASGPLSEINVDRLAQGETVTKPYPWKVYQTTTDMTGNNQPAIRFFQPQMNVQELLAIYQHFDGVFDNVTGFPKYSYGDSRVGGAGRTSSGLAQLLGNVGKGVRRVIAACDRGLIRPKVRRTYEFNMEFDPDPTIKFDLRAVAKGSAAVLIKEQTAMRQKELLQMMLNPMDAQIIGAKGRAEMLRPALKNADFDADEILPDSLEMQLLAATMPPPHEMLGKQGPNAPASPGMGGTGGTPEGAVNLDNAGNPVNGVPQRQAQLGYKDGGVVGRPPYDGSRSAGHGSDAPALKRYRMLRDVDTGDAIIEELP